MKRETDKQFLESLGVTPETPSTWERWDEDGSTLRGQLAETHRQLWVERQSHSNTRRTLNMWKLAAVTAGAMIVMLIFAGWGRH